LGAPIRIRARSKDGVTEVLILMPHPMETGMRADAGGRLVPPHFITDVRVALGERLLLEAKLSIAVSTNPLLSFRFRGGSVGDRITATWVDNAGDQRTDEAFIS
jgi:sulfur-oxidizing protein SoxZ